VVGSSELNLALTSDFPSTANQSVVERMRASSSRPRIAWIPPFTVMGRKRFPAAQALFESYGFSALDYCDIDEEPNVAQLARLDQHDVVYMIGGDPLGFRRKIIRARLDAGLRQYLAAGGLIVAASGGSTQFTKNVSLYLVLTVPLDKVDMNRSEYEALGVVNY